MTRMVNKRGFRSLKKRGLKRGLGKWPTNVSRRNCSSQLKRTEVILLDNFKGILALSSSIGKTNPIIGAMSQVNSYHQCQKVVSSWSFKAEVKVLVKVPWKSLCKYLPSDIVITYAYIHFTHYIRTTILFELTPFLYPQLLILQSQAFN